VGLRRGVSGFVAFTVLLSISTVIALSLYSLMHDIQSLHRPFIPTLFSGYVICYNVTGLSVSLEEHILVCVEPGSAPSYLCVFRVSSQLNVTVVYEGSFDVARVYDGCVALLDRVPLAVYGHVGGSHVQLEVKVYDSWAE